MTPEEQEVLDALIVLALTDIDAIKREPFDWDESSLTLEDHMALDALGDDLVDRILSGEWKPKKRRSSRRRKKRSGHSQLAGAMNRDEGDGNLTDKAKEEIERRVQEIDEEEGKEP